MENIINYIKSRYLNMDVGESTSTLTTESRRNLVQEIEETITDDSMMEDLRKTIQSTTQSLMKMEESERFLNTRITHYRNQLTWIQDESAEEDQDEMQEVQEEKLNQVIAIHRNILIEIEILRRKLAEMEEKMHDMVEMKSEMQDFVLASERIDMERYNSDVNTTELELGSFHKLIPDTRKHHENANGEILSDKEKEELL
jgi:hypothetical protein